MPLTEHPTDRHADLAAARYALLRTRAAGGHPVDTPIWFVLDGATLRFRTKRGPKTRRIEHDPAVELRACDHRGTPTDDRPWHHGEARVLDLDDPAEVARAEEANRALHRRYGWQWNVVPLLPIPGVVNVHRALPWREKLRRARHRALWPDSTIVEVELRTAP